ncbi:MAG: hypothetical protein GY865_00900 [candidate division Zixibacteria bacterium]|nr:hypothetical protein [candidate division Zixibacteria bacterium]
MQKHLIDSTATYPGGINTGHRLFKVSSGLYAGRVVIILQSSSSEIKLTFADYPYSTWSAPTTVINDTGDFPFDALIDTDGNIYLAYTLTTTNDLVTRKLSFSAGNWSTGSLATIYNNDDNYFPSLCLESTGRLWVGWSRLSSGSYYINAKYSDDMGATWYGGAAVSGETLSSGGTTAFNKLISMDDYIYSVYSFGGAKIYYRRKQFNSGTWDSESEIFSGSNLDENLDVASSGDNRIGVVWDDGEIKFKEFDGNNWSGVIVADTNGGEFPQIKYINNVPYLTFISVVESGQNNILYSYRDGTGFTIPEILSKSKTGFAKLFCYDLSSASFEDLTVAAGDSTVSDIFHSDSSAIIKDTGDTLYLGLTEKYHYLKSILSTAGVGGVVNWQYYDGNEWVSFVPLGGAWNFDDTNKGLLLWDDIYSVPDGWQKNSINGSELFWIKVTVTTTFTTGPVGTQMTTVPDIKAAVLMER